MRYSTASHILEAREAGGRGPTGAGTSRCVGSSSGNAGSLASSISCFFSRVQPLREGLGATLGASEGPEAPGRLETCLGSVAGLAVGSSSRWSAAGAAEAGLFGEGPGELRYVGVMGTTTLAPLSLFIEAWKLDGGLVMGGSLGPGLTACTPAGSGRI